MVLEEQSGADNMRYVLCVRIYSRTDREPEVVSEVTEDNDGKQFCDWYWNVLG